MGKFRAKKPEQKEKRLKMFIYGDSGVGKTWASIQFPNAYIIDTERGMDEYNKAILRSNSELFQSANPDEIRDEIQKLLTLDHEYRTLVIDPITQVYNSLQEKWSRVFEKYATSDKEKEVQDFGMRFWGRVKGEYKSLQRLLLPLDMNIIITAHQKDVYGSNFSKLGTTFDSMKGDNYFFDLIFQIEKKGTLRPARTIKERCEPGANKFPEEFEWSYENFCKFYGKEILERKANPVQLATPEQVQRIKKMIETLNIEESVITKWFTTADADSFEEFTSDQITKCLTTLEKKLEEVKK